MSTQMVWEKTKQVCISYHFSVAMFFLALKILNDVFLVFLVLPDCQGP